MTLEDLVPDYDTCQKLKAAGYPQDTPLAHYTGEGVHACTLWHLLKHQNNTSVIAAPTFTEIQKKLLPITTTESQAEFVFAHEFDVQLENVTVRYVESADDLPETVLNLISNDNIAQAAAEMWLWVLENYPDSLKR